MPDLTIKRRWWHPLIQWLAATRFGSWLLADTLHLIDRPLLRLSNNSASFTSWLAGLPVIVLHTTGARSGLPRKTPLVAQTVGERIILIASYFGSQKHPNWYHNVCAHPEVTVEHRGRRGRYRASLVEGEERERYWLQAAQQYPGYEVYRQRAGGRKIPVILLDPIEK
jgi:deazaflavin-dependent oxidoreductase (nitroreductase family)